MLTIFNQWKDTSGKCFLIFVLICWNVYILMLNYTPGPVQSVHNNSTGDAKVGTDCDITSNVLIPFTRNCKL